MKLTTKITVQKIRVIADYQRKEPNPMFTAILKYALENDETIVAREVKNELSGIALNLRMWENILDRLAVQGYFKKEERIHEPPVNNWDYYETAPFEEDFKFYYDLTDFGKEAAEQNTFFKQMKGELEIWIVKDKIDWFPFQVVKIRESYNSYEEMENDEDSKNFKLPLKQILDLKNASFRIEKMEDTCEFLGEEEVELTVNANNNFTQASIKDLELEMTNSKQHLTKLQLQKLFLMKKYEQDFDSNTQTIRIPFNDDIQFQRKVKINKPTIGKVAFNSIDIENVNFMAKTKQDAERWRLAWMRATIRDYIFENDEFEKLAYQIWQRFEPYFELSHLTISDYEDYLREDEKANFYQLMQVQAPQLLTY